MIKTDARLLSLIGLARGAGKVSSGHTAVCEAVKKKKAKLVLLSADCSEQTEDEYKRAAAKLGIECLRLDTIMLGKAVGKPAGKAISIDDGEFAGAILKRISSLNDCGGAMQ